MDEQAHRRTFRGERAELAAVHRFAREALPPGCPVLADFLLLLDEVAANAVLHSDSGRPGGAFEVVIRHRAGVVRAEVHDAGPRRPPGTPLPPAWSQEAGRGLLLVSMLAREWGTVALPHGRVVWFEVADHHRLRAA
ncbi:Histidine kinase-like ATPase domain-containing protein [Thermomonospora echinospora]|uniref:Histidine kinase-like ATPase domain-containing protein n=1 Tax=Thermomonospora echinospora TaxID=1992 RepID=A0A1H5S6T2_9ACTN|nr:ATP-binding protein [Thermomonospora echinospora]SEF46305.1 Histidine kinase-like ATPase domain-containing protein [Thermomonospora echinospora]